MNLNRIINMIMRIIMRKAINKGINTGLNQASKIAKSARRAPPPVASPVDPTPLQSSDPLDAPAEPEKTGPSKQEVRAMRRARRARREAAAKTKSQQSQN